MDITPERLQADWWLMPAVNARDRSSGSPRASSCEAGSRHLAEAPGAMAPATGADPAP